MKQFISKVKNLSQKAAELKAAMERVPPKVAEIRKTVSDTKGQLQQLRGEIQSSVISLKADNEDHLSEALQEINTSLPVFLEAGFEVAGVDLEISPAQRLLVRMNKLEDVHPSVLRSLLAPNHHLKTTHAILSALIQAREMADKVKFTNLHYSEVLIAVGPIPTVRIGWRAEEVFEAETAPSPLEPQVTPVPAPVKPVDTTSTQSPFGQGSFFEKRYSPTPVTPVVSSVPSATTHAEAVAQAPVASHERGDSATPEWKRDDLERFKKSPHSSKYRR